MKKQSISYVYGKFSDSIDRLYPVMIELRREDRVPEEFDKLRKDIDEFFYELRGVSKNLDQDVQKFGYILKEHGRCDYTVSKVKEFVSDSIYFLRGIRCSLFMIRRLLRLVRKMNSKTGEWNKEIINLRKTQFMGRMKYIELMLTSFRVSPIVLIWLYPSVFKIIWGVIKAYVRWYKDIRIFDDENSP